MDWTTLWLVKLLASITLLLQVTGAQLTGSITSPGNAFIITIVISNPTSTTISVLAWNNVFDFTTQLPVSFGVEDDSGNPVQLASTYAMRAGMSKDDLYDIPPGRNLTRIFDLRQVLQSIPSGPTTLGPKSITISLPSSYKGISHDGTYQIPAEAAADLTSRPPQLGDFSASGLSDISVSSENLRASLYFPIFPEQHRRTNHYDGLRLKSDDCQAQNATDLSDAIFDAGIYAQSLVLATTTSSVPLFGYFFEESEMYTVSQIAPLIKSAISGSGPHVDVYCTDGFDLCGTSSNILGYTFTPSWLGDAFIVLCPAARTLGRAPVPCSAESSGQVSATASHVMFHLILTVNKVVRHVLDGTTYGSLACQQMKSSPTAARTKNPDSYAQLAIAQWNYGLGGPPYSGPSCLPANGALPNNHKRKASSRVSYPRRQPETKHHRLAARRFTETTGLQSNMLKQSIAGAQQCTGAPSDLLQFALRNTRGLAAAARDYPFAALWHLYFNGDSNVENHVVNIFDSISKWNTTGDPVGINFYCDLERRTEGCLAGLTASAHWDYNGESAIVLCPQFFYLPVSLQCLNPSAVSRPGMNAELDQGGAILHELLHIPFLADTLIITDGFNDDGSSADCYTYQCATAYAANRFKPGVDSRNNPEFVAINYELYAYAVRASNAGCSWSAYPGYAYGYGQYGLG